MGARRCRVPEFVKLVVYKTLSGQTFSFKNNTDWEFYKINPVFHVL